MLLLGRVYADGVPFCNFRQSYHAGRMVGARLVWEVLCVSSIENERTGAGGDCNVMKNVRFGSLCRGNKLLTYSKMNFGRRDF